MMASESGTQWLLETDTTAYAFGLNGSGHLVHCYWGPRLPYSDDYPTPMSASFWPFAGPTQGVPLECADPRAFQYNEPTFKLTFVDGVRDTDLRFDHAESRADEVIITLRDAVYPLEVELHYRVHTTYDLIERWMVLTNRGEIPLTIERAWSAHWHIPRHETYRLTYLTGRWAEEFQVQQILLQPGAFTLESRRLTTGHQANPWFAIDSGAAAETHGALWFGALAWSGNWQFVAEVTDTHLARLGIGVNDWDFAWQLLPQAAFVTPAAVGGYTSAGFAGARHRLHDFIREKLLPHRTQIHPILYNSWEATAFAVDVASQLALARRAAQIGVELFVMDDGWFQGRVNGSAGLGDWWPDTTKFPDGLGPLIAEVNALGMRFGLWIEPEMVNPASALYRAHPDWVLHFPTRPRSEQRNQLILNLGRTDVQEHLIAVFDRLLTENQIDFIKWDMNRNVSEAGWPDAPGDAREVWVRYVQGVYRVWDTLHQRHPNVIWQACSGGGGRADLGILQRADQIWVSDNTDATARLAIQDGYACVFPASTMESWVTDVTADLLSLTFRFHVSMCGVLGVGANLLRWSDAEMVKAKTLIESYKTVRPIIQNGDYYRLHALGPSAFAALQYMSKDGAAGVLFAFRLYQPDASYLLDPARLPIIYPQGLIPTARYRIEGFDAVKSGLAWMTDGLPIPLDRFESAMRNITRVDMGEGENEV